VYEIIVNTLYDIYRFRPIMRPTSAMSVTVGEYIVTTQML